MVANMADHGDWTPGDVAGMVANPFYAITVDETLTLPHEPLISEDDWVKPRAVRGDERCADEMGLSGRQALRRCLCC
jgi:hypothetical protein